VQFAWLLSIVIFSFILSESLNSKPLNHSPSKRNVCGRKSLLLKIAIPIVSLAITIISLGMVFPLPYLPFSSADQLPTLTEDHRANIKVDLFVEGLSHPTSMAFIDDATILVLEKDTGSIRKITDRILE
jgi:hypothetical protein